MAKKKEVALAQGQVPAEVAAQMDLGDMADFGRDDLAVPFIRVIQTLSPQVKKTKPEYLEDAEEGMIFNTASQELYDGEEGIIIIPAKYQRSYTEWSPGRGGFVADHGDDASILENCVRNDRGAWVTMEGNDIAESAMYYVIIYDTESGLSDHAILTLSGTQWPKARKWNTVMRKLKVQGPDGPILNPAPFAGAYRLTTLPESNDQGDWYGVKFAFEAYTMDLPDGVRLIQEAVLLRKSIGEGNVKVDHTAGKGSDAESDVPF